MRPERQLAPARLIFLAGFACRSLGFAPAVCIIHQAAGSGAYHGVAPAFGSAASSERLVESAVLGFDVVVVISIPAAMSSQEAGRYPAYKEMVAEYRWLNKCMYPSVWKASVP